MKNGKICYPLVLPYQRRQKLITELLTAAFINSVLPLCVNSNSGQSLLHLDFHTVDIAVKMF